MLASLRRIYLYVIASGALLFTTGVLVFFLYTVFRQAGIGSGYLLFDPNPSNQALSFLIVDLLVVVPIGLLHRYFIMRDAKNDATALAGVVRALFVEVVLFSTVLITTFNLVSFVDGITNSNIYNTWYNIVIPIHLAMTVTGGLVLLLLLHERALSGITTGIAYAISMLFGYLAQFIVMVNLLTKGTILIQSIVQQVGGTSHCRIFLESDLTNFGRRGLDCANFPIPSIMGQIITITVLIASMVGLFLWTRRDTTTAYRRISEVVLVWTALVTCIIGMQRGWELLLRTITGDTMIVFPDSLYAYKYYYNDTVRFLPFIGTLLAGSIALTVLLVRIWRLPYNATQQMQPRQLAAGAVAIPLAATFIIGLSQLLSNLFVAVGQTVATSDYSISGSLVLAGAVWLALWPSLSRMRATASKGRLIARRLYEFTILAGTVLAATIAVAIALYIIVSGVIGASADPTNVVTKTALAYAVVNGAVAAYYARVVIRDQQAVPQATVPPEDDAAATLAVEPLAALPSQLVSVLSRVANGTLSVAAATTALRGHYHID